MKMRVFKLPDGDHNVGRIYIPDALASQAGAIIICHGGPGGHQFDPAEADRWVIDPPWVIVSFDNYACGLTGPHNPDMTLDRWGKDTADVYRFVTHLPEVDPSRVGLIGISSGSEAALRCAIDHVTPAFIVSIATCASPNYGDWPAQILCRELEALERGETRECCGLPFKLGFFLDAVGHAPIYNIHKIQCPVYFLQGGADNPKRRGDALMAYEYMAHANRTCKHKEIPGGDHGLDNVVDLRRKEIQNWLWEIGVTQAKP